jgi:hypothetical protein
MRELLNRVAGFTIFVGVFLALVGSRWYEAVGDIIIVADLCIFAVLIVFRNPSVENSLVKFAVVLAILLALSIGLVTGLALATNSVDTSNNLSMTSSGSLAPSSASNYSTTVTVVSLIHTTAFPDKEITITEVLVYQPLGYILNSGNCIFGDATLTTETHTFFEINGNETTIFENSDFTNYSIGHLYAATFTTTSISFSPTLSILVPTSTVACSTSIAPSNSTMTISSST